ncbi:alpha/beta hydrolase [Planococcus maritimus]|uniref:alpha/beta hydrolase n=1 Tax=Planococcus maritimus TaxID=192421 RepID=UPI0007982866|nr:carboxylesterase [Planococcus maritimus]KYG57571.1 carboxylesterase [Planococcus maritimus]OED31294.1 carboxylesterase [Planococcus maritimus]
MRISQPKPFFFEQGPRAVLLLHGFTGNSADVRMLGRFLETKGYTSIAPHYAGHGVAPEELVGTGPEDWWQDVEEAYQTLIDKGYQEIAVAGLSLGGVFSLKLGYTKPIKGIVTMCAPMHMKSTDLMYQGVLDYAREYKKYEGKDDKLIEEEMKKFQEKPMETLAALRELIGEVRNNVDHVYSPLFVVQGSLDKVINPESANIIHDEAESTDKRIKWYEKSGHVITLDQEKKQLHEDIYEFLESLDWSV